MQEMQPILTDELEDLNIERFTPMASPAEIKQNAPMTDRAAEVVRQGRSAIRKVLRGEDKRLLVITGPCSIHDPAAAMDYAQRLAKLSKEVSDQLLLVMRVYFEKPRTVTGWKGYVNDPHMDGSFQIAEGMLKARQLLLDITETGLPLATEALDPFSPQYLGELISWYAIGARTSESQTHREMATRL